MRDIYKPAYNCQKYSAYIRGIDWQFTYETWRNWWGDDIINRGRGRGKLVMARYGDKGPYHPDNVQKITLSQNSIEGNVGKTFKHTQETKNKISKRHKGRIVSAEAGKNISNALKGRKVPWLAKTIKTPMGIFESRRAAATAYNIHPSTMLERMKKYPNEYYYIKETI